MPHKYYKITTSHKPKVRGSFEAQVSASLTLLQLTRACIISHIMNVCGAIEEEFVDMEELIEDSVEKDLLLEKSSGFNPSFSNISTVRDFFLFFVKRIA